jgi:Ca-activated chloride channel family protein
MSFTAPALLWGLLLVPLGLLLYLAAQRRRGRDATRFTNRDLLPNLAPRAPGWRRHVPVAFYLLALSALLIALAGPRAVVPVRQEQATVVMVLDTSISMSAVDVQPTRLAALQAAGRRFLEILPAPVRVGMVAFSAAPQVLAPPTTDRAALQVGPAPPATLRRQRFHHHRSPTRAL